MPDTATRIAIAVTAVRIRRADVLSWPDSWRGSAADAIRNESTAPIPRSAIDANANPPVQSASFATVGTVLFDMAVNPVSGKVYVTNTDAHNEVRFEGSGRRGTTVRGRIVDGTGKPVTMTPVMAMPAVAEGAFRLLAAIAARHQALTLRIGGLPPPLARLGAEARCLWSGRAAVCRGGGAARRGGAARPLGSRGAARA